MRREQALRAASRLLRGVQLVVLVLAGIAAGWGVWVWRAPVPTIRPLKPLIPSAEAGMGRGPVAVVIPESLFRARPGPAAAAANAKPIPVETASAWRLVGVELGPPAAALLKGDPDGKTVWVKAGDTVGTFTVTAIEPGRITMAGEEGEFEIRL